MCMFTMEIEDVSDTKIFARALGPRQILVYEMNYAAKHELAMVLPIPVPPGTPEDGVRFVNLEECRHFFAELHEGFPRDSGRIEMASMMMLGGDDVVEAVKILEVHEVGAYEASFVPTVADFGRLDERFRLPPEIWLELNTYRDYGFAVFKLLPTRRAHAHPMAFEFPTRYPQRLFFPTLHIHDRRVTPSAHYDHTLYCQPSHAMQWHMAGWEDSEGSASEFITCEKARALFDLELPCWRQGLHGKLFNADTWVGEGGSVPQPVAAIV